MRIVLLVFYYFVYMQVANMGTGAIALSLPFSCVLGFLSSMTSSTMGKPFLI